MTVINTPTRSERASYQDQLYDYSSRSHERFCRTPFTGPPLRTASPPTLGLNLSSQLDSLNCSLMSEAKY